MLQITNRHFFASIAHALGRLTRGRYVFPRAVEIASVTLTLRACVRACMHACMHACTRTPSFTSRFENKAYSRRDMHAQHAPQFVVHRNLHFQTLLKMAVHVLAAYIYISAVLGVWRICFTLLLYSGKREAPPCTSLLQILNIRKCNGLHVIIRYGKVDYHYYISIDNIMPLKEISPDIVRLCHLISH